MSKMSRKQRIAQNEISQVRKFTLGGIPQKVMLEGKKKSNPLVICLHGGPGLPIPFSVGCRGLFPDITERLTLVCWDQWGCGANNAPIDNSYGIDHFVNMTLDLIKEIRMLFPDNKILLFGMSWGSILTLKAAKEAGELLDGAVTYGQVLCHMVFNEEIFAALKSSTMPMRKKKQLEQLKGQRTVKNAKIIMNWLRKYTQAYQCRTGEKQSSNGLIFKLFISPDYRFRDFLAIMVNGYVKNISLLQELTDIDLRNELEAIHIPYTMIQGDHDLVTSTAELTAFMEQTKNSRLNMVTIPHSGHFPGPAAMDTIFKKLEELSGSV